SCLIIPSTSFSRFSGNVTKLFCNPSDKTTHLRQMMNVISIKLTFILPLKNTICKDLSALLLKNLPFFSFHVIYRGKSPFYWQFYQSFFIRRGTLLVII